LDTYVCISREVAQFTQWHHLWLFVEFARSLYGFNKCLWIVFNFSLHRFLANNSTIPWIIFFITQLSNSICHSQLIVIDDAISSRAQMSQKSLFRIRFINWNVIEASCSICLNFYSDCMLIVYSNIFNLLYRFIRVKLWLLFYRYSLYLGRFI